MEKVPLSGAVVPLVAIALLASGCSGGTGDSGSAPADPDQAPATPQASQTTTGSGGKSCKATVQQTEGPYWKADSPGRANLRSGSPSGTPLNLTGEVLDSRCLPVRGAILDFWQADGNGEYDNAGCKLRGHQTTGTNGQWSLKTVVPGQYPGRTEHVYVKIWGPGGKVALVTQLYLPESRNNDSDGIYQPSTEIQDLRKTGPGYTGTFDFVLPG